MDIDVPSERALTLAYFQNIDSLFISHLLPILIREKKPFKPTLRATHIYGFEKYK